MEPTANDPRDRSRAGWLVVAIGAVVLGAVGIYLVVEGLKLDPSDPGFAEVGMFLSPLLAAGASVVIGIVLMVVAAFRLIDVALSRAAKATGLGCVVSPIAYVVFLLALADPLGSLYSDISWLPAMLIGALPIVVGVAIVLGYAVDWPRAEVAGAEPVGGGH